MPEEVVIARFERRLWELGCPRRWVRDQARELADHHDDLRRAAQEEGCEEPEIVARADAALGDPLLLAEEAADRLRRSSWWGRHRIIGFCLLPPLAFIPAWFACGFVLALFCRIQWSGDDLRMMADAVGEEPAAFPGLIPLVTGGLTFCALTATALLFSRLARRCAAGAQWAWITCAVCSLDGVFLFVDLQPRAVVVGYTGLSRLWYYSAVPMLVAAAGALRQRRLAGRLPPIPAQARAKPARDRGWRMSFPGRAWRTPTYWLMAAITAGVGTLIARDKARDRELETRVWPAERAATLAHLRSRQTAADATNEVTIPLRSWQNETLWDPRDGHVDRKDNNLGELPTGVHIFGGASFDVEGKIQLAGKPLARTEKALPGRVNGIRIGMKCARLHLLHAASHAQETGRRVARLELHYTDGSRAEIEIVAGKHLLDWWGPTYTTEAGDEAEPTAPGTELAWSGSNPWIQQRAPEYSLRLYQSTFTNPHPELVLETVDYVSTLSGAAPFLAGLTVEPSPSPPQ